MSETLSGSIEEANHYRKLAAAQKIQIPKKTPGTTESKHWPRCPACGQPGKLVAGNEIYPGNANMAYKNFYACFDCDTRVGCHDGGRRRRPLGTMAGKELRKLRVELHRAMDHRWEKYDRWIDRKRARSALYWRMSCYFGMKPGEFHVSWLNKIECEQATDLLKRWDIEQMSPLPDE